MITCAGVARAVAESSRWRLSQVKRFSGSHLWCWATLAWTMRSWTPVSGTGVAVASRSRPAATTVPANRSGRATAIRRRAAPGHEQRGGQAGRRHGEQAEPVGADERHRLQRRVADRPDQGDRVPRELEAPGAADGLGQRPGHGEGQGAGGDRAPGAQGHQGRGQADGERQEQGEAQHGRHRVGTEALRVGEERDADPVEPGQEEAEAERRAAQERAPGAGCALVQHGQEHAEPGKSRQEVERRQGRGRRHAGREGGERGVSRDPGPHAVAA